ncbi:release factor glutamine methyltransferase [Desulfonispora thiosulfatigenes DSM 11270]|uniref:Release factor glutamine methyltransferase n=1 Tax=Desulfonispora thiosulfatigenes DSM 11270 TaxID=656914 RepID=A0A1W1V482_DESTI|nr:peptide chain release factor N(5)-glutamine methyltransferase [Desulfonispora thiosulfatigenes]SMB88142.1 release factor glutamine methyltransferase [Desulfonispora thiosulfatigenes DSM 11270]
MERNSKPQTVKEILQWAVIFLGRDKRLEAELLLAQVLNFSRAKLLAYPEKVLNQDELHKFVERVNLRKDGEPLQYILGTEDFMGLDFKVTENVLIPRSDTEIMVEKVIENVDKTKSIRILDLCTGSGAIAVSLAKYLPLSKITAVDISAEALDVARFNARANEVDGQINFCQSDLFKDLDPEMKFEIIVSNPPYITSREMTELPKDVQKEPHLALWGGLDGLDFYRRIAKNSPEFIIPGGELFLEIGYKQALEVSSFLQTSGFKSIEVIKDWNQLDRVVYGKY